LPVTTDIAATYRRPKAVAARLMARAPSEARALAYLMGGCAIMFVAQWPAIARRVYESDPARWQSEAGAYQDAVAPEIGGALLASVFFLPLIFYGLALLGQGATHLLKPVIEGYDARVALFWALLAATPLALLNGMVAGFVGPGPAYTLVGALWFGVFVWFWMSGMRAARELAKESRS